MNDNTFYLLLTIYIVGIVIVAGVYSAIQSAKYEDSNPLDVVPKAMCFGFAWPLVAMMGILILTAPFFGIFALTKYITKKKKENKIIKKSEEKCKTI